MSTRTLSRRFASRWERRGRVACAGALRRAQRLLETTDLAIEQVATEAASGPPP